MQKCIKRRHKQNILLVSAVLLAGIFGIHKYAEGGFSELGNDRLTVRINEVCANNFSVCPCEDGAYHDYIELYNPAGNDISLKGYTLSDNTEDLKKFVFGEQTIKAGGYLLIYASGENADEQSGGEVHVPFKLSNRGECLFLNDPDGVLADFVEIPSGMKYNVGYGRKTNGSGEWAMLEPTPACSNAQASEKPLEVLEVPAFSAESGFYEEPFYLELKDPKEMKIYYTLDGSEPLPERAECYVEPILIRDASENENVHSARTDLSAGFFMEDDRYAVPEEKVDKAFIVRAAVFDESGLQKSETVTKTYFVGFDEKEYENLEVVSLVTDPENLFDYEIGIYVAGKTFDDFVESGKREEMSNPDMWRKWQANYMNRGKEWERPVHVDYFGADRELVFSQELGLRIKGGTTRSYTQKSFNLFARGIYGKDEFEVPFFGDKAKRRVTLYTVANDYRSKLRDPLLMDLCSERAFATMESRPCYVFLDGEYWGMYYLMEKYGDDYLKEHYGVEVGDAVIAKDNQTEEATDHTYLEQLEQYIADYDLQSEEEYRELDTILDMRSYLDYYATEVYIERSGDWPIYNEAYWRTKEKSDKPWYDGRWRWMIYDVNWSCLSDSIVEENTIEYVKEKSELFNKLSCNQWFQKDFTITICDLMNTVFKVENVAPDLMDRIEKTKMSVIRDLKKYYGNNITAEDYEEDADDLAKFFLNRPAYMVQHLKESFGLIGSLENVTVGATEGGSVQLNTVLVPEGTEFTGGYFTDYPVVLTAVPKEGYCFLGWQRTDQDTASFYSQQAETEVKPEHGGSSYLAVFEKE